MLEALFQKAEVILCSLQHARITTGLVHAAMETVCSLALVDDFSSVPRRSATAAELVEALGDNILDSPSLVEQYVAAICTLVSTAAMTCTSQPIDHPDAKSKRLEAFKLRNLSIFCLLKGLESIGSIEDVTLLDNNQQTTCCEFSLLNQGATVDALLAVLNMIVDPQAGDVPTLVDTCVLAGEILESLVMLHPKSCELVASSVFWDKGRAWARLFQVTDKFSLPLAKILYQCFSTCNLVDSTGRSVKFSVGGFGDKVFSILYRLVKDLAARELLAGECLEESLITLLNRRFQLDVSARDLEWAAQPSRTTLNRKRRRGDEVDWTAEDTGVENTYMASPAAAAAAPAAAPLGPPVPTDDEEVAEMEWAAEDGGLGDHEMRSRKRAGALVEGATKKKRRSSSENADSTPLGRAASSSIRPPVNKKRKKKAPDPDYYESESESEPTPPPPSSKFFVNHLDKDGNVVPEEMGMKEYTKVINSESNNRISLDCDERVEARAFFRIQPDRSQDPDDVVAAPNTPTDITSIEGRAMIMPPGEEQNHKVYPPSTLEQIDYVLKKMKTLVEGRQCLKPITAGRRLLNDKQHSRALQWLKIRGNLEKASAQYLAKIYGKPEEAKRKAMAWRVYSNEEKAMCYIAHLGMGKKHSLHSLISEQVYKTYDYFIDDVRNADQLGELDADGKQLLALFTHENVSKLRGTLQSVNFRNKKPMYFMNSENCMRVAEMTEKLLKQVKPGTMLGRVAERIRVAEEEAEEKERKNEENWKLLTDIVQRASTSPEEIKDLLNDKRLVIMFRNGRVVGHDTVFAHKDRAASIFTHWHGDHVLPSNNALNRMPVYTSTENVRLGSYQHCGVMQKLANTLGGHHLISQVEGKAMYTLFKVEDGISCVLGDANHIHGSTFSLFVDSTDANLPPVVRFHSGDCKAEKPMLEALDRAMDVVREAFPEALIETAVVDNEAANSTALLSRKELAAEALEKVRRELADLDPEKMEASNVAVLYFCYNAGSRGENLGLKLAEMMDSKLYQEETPHLVSHFLVEDEVAAFRGKGDVLSRHMGECRVIQVLPPGRGNKLDDILERVGSALPASVKHLVVLSSAGWARNNFDMRGQIGRGQNPLTYHNIPMQYSDHSTRAELARLVLKLKGYGLKKDNLVALRGHPQGGYSCAVVNQMWQDAQLIGGVNRRFT